MEEEGAIYHVINRGNYRSDIFRGEKTKAAFLKCLGEACEKTGWRVHAWCIMSNHYHLALETPRANLVDGMRWLQGTFSTRFNRLRKEQGHLFQGRYKALPVDPATGLGPLCHYIHLNPVRARMRSVAELAAWPWTSLHWLTQPKRRTGWYEPASALDHAGSLRDSAAGRRKYVEYLAWLSEDEPARKAMAFESMSSGWAIGSAGFQRDLAREHAELLGQRAALRADAQVAREAVWLEALDEELKRQRKSRAAIAAEGKSVEWKLAVAAMLKRRTTATNRWLAESLHMGNMYEVSRKVAAWMAAEAVSTMKTPNHKT